MQRRSLFDCIICLYRRTKDASSTYAHIVRSPTGTPARIFRCPASCFAQVRRPMPPPAFAAWRIVFPVKLSLQKALAGVPPRFSIARRSDWMPAHGEYVVSYAAHDFFRCCKGYAKGDPAGENGRQSFCFARRACLFCHGIPPKIRLKMRKKTIDARVRMWYNSSVKRTPADCAVRAPATWGVRARGCRRWKKR